MKYDIIFSRELVNLKRLVNDSLENGWELAGNFVAGDGGYYQPIITGEIPKKIEKEENIEISNLIIDEDKDE